MNRTAAILLFAASAITIASFGRPVGAAVERAMQAGPKASALFGSVETLKYGLLWPSGVSLGEGVFVSSATQSEVQLELKMDADLPIHNISGVLTATATLDGLCSIKSHKKTTEGSKVSEETVEFDQKSHLARRTAGGNTTSLTIPDCARDPLVFLYYFRNQLAKGSPVDTATFFSGPGRSLEILSAGKDNVVVRGQKRASEKYRVTYRGSNSERTFEVWVAADALHEPVMVSLPSPLAIFSAELE